MIAGLDALFAAYEGFAWHLLAVFLRVGPVMGLIPGFSENSVPMRIRLVLALCMTLVVAPGTETPWLGLPPDLAGFLAPALIEILIGVLLGLGLRLFVLTLQTAGSISAQSTSLSQIFGGTAAEPLPAFGHVLVIAGIALAMMLGLHVHAAHFLVRSYEWLPFGNLPGTGDVMVWGMSRVTESFGLAFRIALPFLVVSIVYNLTLGAINRAMPLLMVAFVGAPVITAGGLILLAILAPLMIGIWHEAFSAFLIDPRGAAR